MFRSDLVYPSSPVNSSGRLFSAGAAVKKLLSWIFGVLSAALLIYAGLFAALYLNQTMLIYQPVREWTGTPRQVKLPYEEVTLHTKDGISLSAWYVPVKKARGIVLFCHGNARNMSSDVHVIRMFTRLGLSVLAFDYRGYGRSGGSPDEEGLYRDAEAAWNYLTLEKKILPDDILIWGRSLGGGVAVEAALRRRPKALILEAAFTSLDDIAAERYPLFPVRQILKSQYDNLGKISRVDCPILIVHSREDTIIPIRHGRALFSKAREPKQFLEIRGPHKGLPWQAGYEEGLRAFLDSLVGADKRM